MNELRGSLARGLAVLLALLGGCSAEQPGQALGPTPSGPEDGGQGAPSSATTGGGSPATGGGPVASTGTSVNPDETACEVLEVAAVPKAADMLVVLDRSLSMIRQGRWEPSVEAVRSITTDLDDELRFGLMVFPGPEPEQDCAGLPADQAELCRRSNANSPDCRVGRMEVPIADRNGAAIASVLDDTTPRGATPTSASLEQARAELAADAVRPDYVPNDKYVLLVTDGQPGCVFATGENPGADASYAAVEALVNDGVPVYVVGYDTQGTEFATVLDRMAQLGGTGDIAHRPVEDEQSLRTELRSIVGAAVSCTYELETPAFDPAFVRVRVDGTQVDLDDPNGWTKSGDQTIRLQGKACEGLQDGNAHTVKVTVECGPII